MKKNSIAQAILAIIIVISIAIKIGHAIHAVRWALEREYPGAASQLRLEVIFGIKGLAGKVFFLSLFGNEEGLRHNIADPGSDPVWRVGDDSVELWEGGGWNRVWRDDWRPGKVFEGYVASRL